MKRIKLLPGVTAAPFLCIIFVLCAAVVSSCAGGGKDSTPPDVSNFTRKAKQTTDYFGTVSVLCVYDDFSKPENAGRFERLWTETRDILEELEAAISVSVETSDIARFNALSFGESVGVSLHTARIIETMKNLYLETGGRYDPTVYPLVDLWGFTPRFASRDYAPSLPYDRPRAEGERIFPEKKYIDAFLQLADFNGVVLSGNEDEGYTLTKMIPPVTVDGVTYQAMLDLGGIGKGYASDLIRAHMAESGYSFGYFSCGSSSMAMLKGMNTASVEDGTYRFELGLRKPRPGTNGETGYLSVLVGEMGLSTSGDYDHAYFIGGVRYCHIIDTGTGYPVNMPADGVQKGTATATVIGPDAAFNDGLSTSLCAMPFDEALDFINGKLRDYMVALVLYHGDYDYFEVVTNIPDGDFFIRDEAYLPASRLDDNGNVEYTGTFMSLEK